jgi:N-sulfoglucosamine sulfohydrolase
MFHITAIIAIFSIILPNFSHALDSNQNGISDVWEALHPAAAADPNGDADGDGLTNRQEGHAWTDPADPASFFRVESYQHLPGSDQFGWPGEPWMRDVPRGSADLLEWPRLAATSTGSGATGEVTATPSGPAGFYRVVRHESLNSDTDALTNKEEALLGTNPLLWDTDGDKVPDDVEFLQGTDPLSSTDSDGDGLPDDWEEWCIRHDPDDAVTSLADVNPGTDFDGDGVNDGTEFALGTSPVKAVKNVLLFLSEDQGVDLGCMGTAGLQTPSIDSLASGGVLFERAFAMSPVCSTSKMSMFTSQFCHQNSTWRNVSNYGTDFPLTGDPSLLNLGGVHEDLPTLIEILRDHGFFTATSHKTHVQPIRKWPYNKGYGQPTTAATATSYINDLVTRAGDRPFHMTFGVGAPHLPFRSIAKNQGVWSDTGGLANDGHVTNVDANAITVPNCWPDLPGVRQDIADYYGAIQCVDTVFGAVMAALQANGVLDETLVIFTSDHGIGLHRSKQSIYPAGTRVPFIVAGAGIAQGLATKTPVSHADLLPTILDYLGIPRLPSLAGRSLMPILSGSANDVPGRETVLTTAQDFSDGRAVCDGKYYYINNVRKVAGGSLANPQAGLNTDQYQSGSPWYNRTYGATVAATGTPAHQLLSDLLTGNVPDEELYDLDADPWAVNNLAADPAHATVKARLRRELNAWRVNTEDYNISRTEVTRRELRYEDPTGGGIAPAIPVVDDFNGKSGNLGADPSWTTLVAGNAGADFTFAANAVDAPGGTVTLARWDPASLAEGGSFSVSVKTGFDGNGVAGGIAFGIEDNGGGGFSWWQFLLADGRSSTGGTGKDLRLFRVEAGAQVSPPALSENGLADYITNGSLFTLEVSGQEGSSLVSLRVFDPTGAVWFSNPTFDLGLPVPAGSGFGITTWSSGASIFDDFALKLSGGPRSVALDFDSGSGNLSDAADWTLASPGNSGADFIYESTPFAGQNGKVIDAPAGPSAVAIHNHLALESTEGFTATVDTGFAGAGIFGGLVFGFTDINNFLTLELADGSTAQSSNRLFRIRQCAGGVFTDILFPAAGTFPNVARDALYRLSVEGTAGGTEITYTIANAATSAVLATANIELPVAIASGSKFGFIAASSNSSKFDNLTISTTP